jgi:hypothetical protein
MTGDDKKRTTYYAALEKMVRGAFGMAVEIQDAAVTRLVDAILVMVYNYVLTVAMITVLHEAKRVDVRYVHDANEYVTKKCSSASRQGGPTTRTTQAGGTLLPQAYHAGPVVGNAMFTGAAAASESTVDFAGGIARPAIEATFVPSLLSGGGKNRKSPNETVLKTLARDVLKTHKLSTTKNAMDAIAETLSQHIHRLLNDIVKSRKSKSKQLTKAAVERVLKKKENALCK